MKSKLKQIATTFSFLLILGCASAAFGQDDDEAGGYVPARVNDAIVVAAANFAVREKARKSGSTIRLTAVKKASQQVVAGMNYELCLEVSVKPAGADDYEAQYVTVVVYQNLQKVYALTSWAESDCAD